GPFLKAFEIYLSTSSGKRDMSHEPVASRTTRDLALATHEGCCFAGTSQSKNTNATTTMIRPRASPNRKPRVRSSAPMRLSRTLLIVRAETPARRNRVPRKGGDEVMADAMMWLLKYCWA